MKILVIVDMQNDFVTGALGSKEAQAAVPNIVDLVETGEYDRIYATLDTHKSNYLETLEGKKLPVPHCIEYTNGWLIQPDILDALQRTETKVEYITKPTFGSFELERCIEWDITGKEDDCIDIVGVCTDICVVSNALILRAACPDTTVRVIVNACAGTTPENHKAALAVMKACQIDLKVVG